MIGVILFDAQQRVPIFHNSHMSREFVDGALDVVLADRASQFAYVVGPPSLYRGGSAVTSSASPTGGDGDGLVSAGDVSNSNSQQADQIQNNNNNSNKLSNCLLHASLLSGVVESQHKIEEVRQLQQQQQQQAGNGQPQPFAPSGAGQRPPHWPRLVRAPGVSLGRAAISPSCPVLHRNAAANGHMMLQLTQRQIHCSKALNEGCVSLAAGSSSSSSSFSSSSSSFTSSCAHAWLHPSVAPVTTEYAAEWISSYGGDPHPPHASPTTTTTTTTTTNTRSRSSAPHSAAAASPPPIMVAANPQSHLRPTVATAAVRSEDDNAALLLSLETARASLPTTWNFFWRIFGDSLGVCYVVVSYPPKSLMMGWPASSSSSSSSSVYGTYEENTPGVKQSMANLFVLLCEAFKTVRAVEPPTSKQLVSNLDLVQEVVEIVCPGNGRCMPLMDTPMARKIWRMRNE